MDLDVTLPIAGVTLNIFSLIGTGLLGGFITGMLGLGGGTTITPMLMFLGVHPLIAVTCQVNSAIGITLTGFLNYLRHNDVDVKLGMLALIGGFFGAFAGVKFANWVESTSGLISVISYGYIIVLTTMGSLLLFQSLKTLKKQDKDGAKKVWHSPQWAQKLPLVTYFPRTRVTLSGIIPFTVGGVNAILTALLGIGNGVFMLPILSYLVGRTSPVVYGTTLLASVAMFIFTTFLHAIESSSVDLLLVLFLLMGGTIGTQIGVKISYHFPRPYLGLAGAFLLFGISLKFMIGLFLGSWSFAAKSLPHQVCSTGFLGVLSDFSHSCPELTAVTGILLAISVAFFSEGLTRLVRSFFYPEEKSPPDRTA